MTVRILIVCGGSGVNLLGQRSMLEVNAELQIDASREIRIRQQKALDPFSYFVELDKGVGTTGLLFQEFRKRVKRSATPPLGCIYLHEAFYQEPDIHHFELLANYSPANVPLERGLAQSPAIGGLTIRHPQNRQELERALEAIAVRHGIGPANPVEAWIVSSTAGGTGEGIHRFVGAFLADFISRRHAGTPVTLNFIRVGQLTYRTVNLRQTALNTFFGVAADAAFALKMPQDFPELVSQWFYVDLPDVGTGDRSIPIRAQLVEMAAKAVMQEELHDDLQKLLVNNRGIPMILTRTGYWGKDFGEQRKYYEALRQLRGKLQSLLTPDYERKYIEKRQKPEFVTDAQLDEWCRQAGDARHLLRRIEGGWRFPYRVRTLPQSLGEVQDLAEEWAGVVAGLVGKHWEDLRMEWMVEQARMEEGEERVEKVPLRVVGTGDTRFGEEAWFRRIEEAHEARAWAWFLLGCDLETGQPRRGGQGNRIEDLLTQARRIARALYGFNPLKGSEARAQDAAALLKDFVRRLAEVQVLLRLEADARRLLEGELSGVREILEVTDSEFEIMQRAVGGSSTEVIRVAELYDPLERVTRATWLQLLRDAVRRGDRGVFRREVLRGATGLTEAGLREILALRPQAVIADMHLEMATQMGKMYDPDGNPYEAPWWAATTATPQTQYEYRILPWLSPELQAVFNSYDPEQTGFRYVFTRMGSIGLYVLAFQGISLTRRPGDTTSTPTYLIPPFIPQLREALREWKEKPVPGEPSGQLRLVSAGVCGEPLYLRPLREAGLSNGELEKIGQFYQFFE